MTCALEYGVHRASIGLFGPTLLVILNKRAKKAARLWKQRKLQSTMAMLAALTLLSVLVRGGVEQNPGSEFDQAMDKLYSRIESRLSQAEGQITFQTMEEMQRQINCDEAASTTKPRHKAESQKRSPVTAHRDTACSHTSHSPVKSSQVKSSGLFQKHCGRKQRENHEHRWRPMPYS